MIPYSSDKERGVGDWRGEGGEIEEIVSVEERKVKNIWRDE